MANEAGADLSGASVVICGTKTATAFNPCSGQVGPATGQVADITAISPLGAGDVAYAIVVPQTVAAGTGLVKISTPNKDYAAKAEADVALEGGKAYRFTVRIEEEAVTLALGSATVNGWESPTEIGGSATEEEEESPEDETSEIDNGAAGDPDSEQEPSADPNAGVRYASFGTPEENAKYDAATGKYSWTSADDNKMACFTFENGELEQYKTFAFTFSGNTKGRETYRIQLCLIFNDDAEAVVFSSETAGAHTIAMMSPDDNWSVEAMKGRTLADVKEICLQSQVPAGHCTVWASEMYISK